MAEKKKKKKQETMPKRSEMKVPPERWIVHPPFDSADYLEGEPPRYADPDTDAAPDADDAPVGGTDGA